MSTLEYVEDKLRTFEEGSDDINKKGYCSIDDCYNVGVKLSQSAIKKLEESYSCFLTYKPKAMCLDCMKWINESSQVFSYDGEEILCITK